MKLQGTNYLVDYVHGHAAARDYYRANANASLAASTGSLFELAFGLAVSTRALDDLMASLSWVEFLAFSPDDALEGARIQAEAQATGRRLPIADSMIAGAARNRGAALVAGDDRFDAIEGLDVERHRT